ncbi:MAG: hypothetical protein ACE5KA_07450 [Nitrososphaerales archaeon]
MSGVTASALAQEDRFSARVLAKGKKSVIMILVVNSSKSTNSIHEFEITFTQGKPIVAIARGWDSERDGNTMTFTATRSDLGPSGRTIFIIKISDPASAVFEWTADARDGSELQSGEVTKIRIREPPKDSILPQVTQPEVNVDNVKVAQGEQLKVSGKGYNANSEIIIYIDQQEIGRVIADVSGMFNTVILIPSNIATGLHLIKAVDTANKSSIIQILIEAPVGSLPPLEGGRLVVRTDREEYIPGDLVRLTGSAVLDTPVSLQITDPRGGIICGTNPAVDNKTLLWDATCPVPGNAIAGRYTVFASQIVHKTTTVFTVVTTNGGNGGTGTVGEPGEDPGTLKISTDKEMYKVGDTAQITITGARPESLLDIIIDGPGSPTAQRVTVDEAGSITFPVPLSGSDAVGVWTISAKQMSKDQKQEFVVRKQFTVEP